MVVLDEKRDRIHCTIRNPQLKYFEGLIEEGKVYIMSNFDVKENSLRFKPTRHTFRVFFKKDTQVKEIVDDVFPLNGFDFVPNSAILAEKKEDGFLVDVIGTLAAKTGLHGFTKNDRTTNYVEIQLDDYQSNEKIRCTLWEDFGKQFLKHLEEHPASSYVLILQLGKMKFFSGSMGVSNTNYTSNLFINADFPEVHEFRKRISESQTPLPTPVIQIDNEPYYSLEEDLLNHSVYKSIYDLKEIVEKSTVVTVGTVKEVDDTSNWWYKGCKKCFQGLMELSNSFYCKKCETYPTTFVPRYRIKVKVADETGTASFNIFDKEASKFLNMSANDLRASYIKRGGDKKQYPEEIIAFKDKKFIFKVSVKVEDLNSFQPCVINVMRICSDESIITSFVQKHKIDESSFLPDVSGVFSDLADLSELNKDFWSQSFEVGTESEAGTSITPTTKKGDKDWEAQPSQTSVDDSEQSSTKLRKVMKKPEE